MKRGDKMNERLKRYFLQELNNLETAIYCTDDKELYWHCVGKQEGMLKALSKLGYSVKYKYVEIHGDEIMQFDDIEYIFD